MPVVRGATPTSYESTSLMANRLQHFGSVPAPVSKHPEVGQAICPTSHSSCIREKSAKNSVDPKHQSTHQDAKRTRRKNEGNWQQERLAMSSHRTFPISPFLSRGHSPAARQVCKALDFLYLGKNYQDIKHLAVPPGTRSHHERLVKDIMSRLDRFPSVPTDIHLIYSSKTSIADELEPFLKHFHFEEVARGEFRLLNAEKIDLTKQRPHHHVEEQEATKWLQALPKHISSQLSLPLFSDFIQPMLANFGLHSTKEIGRLHKIETSAKPSPIYFPTAKVFSLPGHFGRILDRADAAGMLNWSFVDLETPEFRHLSDKITMTSFAVTKNEERDRLISWPLVQNALMPDPSAVKLPSSEIFSRLRADSDSKFEGFYFDVDNMYHNIVLPNYMAIFFPLQKERFGNLPG